MVRLSANLGYLWKDQPLPDAIRRAAAAGFHAVECHFPYAVPPEEVKAALAETGLPMRSLNTRMGDPDRGDRGLLSLKGREAEARDAIDQAIDYAARVGVPMIHAMAGLNGDGDTYRANLDYGARRAAECNVTLLIEPINPRDVPGFFMNDLETAKAIVAELGHDSLKIMFDCYHIQILHGDVITRFTDALPMIGHVQFAAVPDRGEPDAGEVNYAWLLPEMVRLGYDGWFGAEYRPRGDLDAGLGWMGMFR